MTDESTTLTPKARQTRQHILETALDLFIANGYEATTMRDIAAAADCSLGLAYRYFKRKEDLVLAFYLQMAAETTAQIDQLPPGSLADRFYQVMVYRLSQAQPYREALSALFGAAMNPHSGIGVMGSDAEKARMQALAAFVVLVRDSDDAPRPGQIEHLATLLDALHFALILFWFYDRSPGQRATEQLLVFTRDTLTLLRRLLRMPFVAQGLARLAVIFASVFGQPDTA